jgi:H+-transporting ATPase
LLSAKVFIVGTQIFRYVHVRVRLGRAGPAWSLIGLVWAYNLVWMFVQDAVKFGIYSELNSRAKNQTPFLQHLKAVVHPHGALHRH